MTKHTYTINKIPNTTKEYINIKIRNLGIFLFCIIPYILAILGYGDISITILATIGLLSTFCAALVFGLDIIMG